MWIARSRVPAWTAVPLAIAMAAALALALDRAASPAAAQAGAGFTFSKTQLVINQRISQAAVRRSNRANTRLDELERKMGGGVGGAGAGGAQGPQGPPGPPGAAAAFSAEKWGVIGRNTFGSPQAQYRVGPFGRTAVDDLAADEPPPAGEGSLGLLVHATGFPTEEKEKIAFGNQTDFAGLRLSDLSSLSYWAFADMDPTGPPGGGVGVEFPNVTLEIDPDLPGVDYTSMVFRPGAIAAADVGRWKRFDAVDDGNALWGLTGAAGTATGCTLSSPCTLDALRAALGPDAQVTYSLGFSKGRDDDFRGAVDALEVNGTLHDFEPLGVRVTTP